MFLSFRVFALLFILAAAAVVATAQIATGTIVGTVTAQDGGVIPNAAIKMTQNETSQVHMAHTNDQGSFNAPFMPLGTYTVSVTAPGFQTKVLSGITLQIDQTANLTVSLAVGSVTQSVEVTEATPLVDTTTSSLGQVIDNHEVLSMPLNGRNALALGLLTAGTEPVYGMGTNLPFTGGAGRFSSMDVSLNGIDDNTFATNGSIGRQGYALVPSVDAVDEFKVMTNNFAAEYGHAAGTIISATLKAGTNKYHGSLFEFVRNQAFDANNFFTNRAGLPRTPFHQNQFGGTVGGPILHQRLYFFADYQGTRMTTKNGSSIESIPPMAFRTGDFSSSTTTIYDPRTRHIGPNGTVVATSFQAEGYGNKIPANLINPTATQILTMIPAPNFGAPGAQSANYFYTPLNYSNVDQGDIRLDATLTAKNRLFGTYSISDQSQPAIGAFPGWIGGGSPAVNNSYQATITDVHSFTVNLVNEFRIGHLFYDGTQSGSGQQGSSFAKSAGIAQFPSTPQGFPQILFFYGGGSNGSAEFNAFGGGDLNLNTLQTEQLSDNLNWIHGKHSIKTGAEIRKSLFDILKGTPFFGGQSFGATFSSSSDAPGSGLPFADFLMGYPTSVLGSPMIAKGRQRNAYVAFYVQDDWKATQRLTLNAGVRYELYTQPIDQNNLGDLFDIRTGQFAIPGKGGYSRAMVQGDHRDLGPRLGFAYQATPKLVFRGGYGIFYAMRDQNQSATQFSGNTPNVPTVVLPSVSATTTVNPPYTMNTPINIVPATASLAGFTAAKPYSVQIRTQSLTDALMPRLMQYNLNLEYQVSQHLLFSTAYSGASGVHFASFFIDENQIPMSKVMTGTTGQANRPYPYMGSNILTIFSNSRMNYNALNLKAQQQFAHGLQFLANYTWQRNIESNGDGPDAYTQGATSIVLNSYDLPRERGVSSLNIGQIFSASALYELPFGAGRRFANTKGVLNNVIGGWVLNGIVAMRTGFPSEIHASALPTQTFATYNVASCVAGASKRLPNPGVDGFFNPAAFTVPINLPSSTGAQVTQFGNCGKRNIVGPRSKNLDSSLFKNFYFSESQRVYLQFRAEAFNTTNTPTFELPSASDPTLTCTGTPGSTCSGSSFGKLVNGSASGRQLQFAAKLYF